MFIEFGIGAVSACGSCFFTNPLEVVKTRFQLQGELQAKGQYKIIYRNIAHAAIVIAKNDGLMALQKGLAPALVHQVLLNGTRLGLYQLAEDHKLNLNAEGRISLGNTMMLGFGAGIIGAYMGSPVYLFAIGAAASVGACYLTNPMEVVKTRFQLQGELQARGQHAVVYRNFGHAAYLIARHEGIISLQKGILPATSYHVLVSGLRLGSFQFAQDRKWDRRVDGKVSLARSVLLGAVVGGCLAVVGSPMQLVKVWQQSQASSQIAVGTQHRKSGMYNTLRTIYRQHGVLGLWRGAGGSVPRLAVGSATQLGSFSVCKEFLETNQMLSIKNTSLVNTFAASMIGGIVVAIFMGPLDVISTRLYNQGVDSRGRGLLYTSYFDCVTKIWRTEGFNGFYKGIMPCYFRIGPHTVLSLVFWDFLKGVERKYFAMV